MLLWKNPHPDKQIVALEVKGEGQGIPGLLAVSLRRRQVRMRGLRAAARQQLKETSDDKLATRNNCLWSDSCPGRCCPAR